MTAEKTAANALFHLGLHKTGTTSFQHGLFRAREQLHALGVVYPAPPSRALPEQHAEIAAMLKLRRIDEVRAYFRGLVDTAGAGARLFLFSSEEFSNLGLVNGALPAFKQTVEECFAESRYVLVLRNALELTLSMLRQKIDAGMLTPSQAASKTVILNDMLLFPRKVRLLLGGLAPVTVIDYEEAQASGDLNNFFARKCLGSGAPILENLKLNVGRERDERMVGLLSSPLRSMIAALRGANPYTADVNAKLAELVDERKLAESLSSAKVARVAQLFDARLREIATAVYSANSQRLLEEASGLPESCVHVLFPGLVRGS